jgi:ABC-type sugar transport system substrate-binding protein
MRATLKKSIALSLAALTVSAGLVASAGPAAAKPFPKPFPIHHYHGFGPWVALGVIGAAAAAAADDSCIQYRPVYDAWGDYLGRRAVNVCE